MLNYLQLLLIILSRQFLKLFYIFPVRNNRILFSSSEGDAYNCNPKYVYLELKQECGDNLEYIWCLNNKSNMPATERVRIVRFLSLYHVYYLLTSKVIISNLGIEPFVPKRKSQLFINTWHGGGCYKDSGINSTFISKSRAIRMSYMRNIRSKMTDFLLSSCRAFTDCYSVKFNVPKERILEIGLPRNDMFFYSQEGKRKIICDRFGINNERLLVLYAPTFRGNWRDSRQIDLHLDVSRVSQAVKEKFGRDCVLLFRDHRSRGVKVSEGSVDVSLYQDMQEILYASDILITDYSSSIWDFSLTLKPGFLFVPDLDEYEAEANFHTPIEKWQYPIARDMDALCSNIMNYDRKTAVDRICRHFDEMGSFENGKASKRLCRIITNYCGLSDERL